MSHNAVRVFRPRLAPWLLTLGMLGAGGCSEEPKISMSQLADDPATPPKIKAILASDKTEKEKNKLIKDELFGTNSGSPAGKKGSKAKTAKKPLPPK
jgi:hypothetical protein